MRTAVSAGGGGVNDRHDTYGTIRGVRVIRHRANPRGVLADLVRDPGMFVEHQLPARGVRACTCGLAMGARHNDGVEAGVQPAPTKAVWV